MDTHKYGLRAFHEHHKGIGLIPARIQVMYSYSTVPASILIMSMNK